MRRPVKPFVTEYRGTARRQPAQAGLPLRPDDEIETPPSKWSLSEAPRRSAPPVEDGYEAALRAADALFSGAPTVDRVEPRADLAPTGETSGAASGGGRILQAIEATPPALDLEPDRAPKRRGRKPGSKNKPKLVALLAPEASSQGEERLARDKTGQSGRPAGAALRPRDGSASTASAVAHRRSDTSSLQSSPSQSAEGETVETQDTAIAPARNGVERHKSVQFPWVRTKLKAGENWKRRLPKVLW